MEEYKVKFIDFLLKNNALKIFQNPKDDRTLKSKRISPWFVNIGDFNDGNSTNTLAGFYADSIINSGVEAKVLYGIPDKGVGLVAPIAMAMASKGHNIGWFFSRKDEKTHGEATNLGPEDRIKKLTVGMTPKLEDPIVQLDDVFTAGDTKYEANAFLKSLGRTNLPLLAIAVDRQEVAIDSKEAIAEYQEKTGTKVVSIVNAVEIYNLLKQGNLASERSLERLANYIRVYGTKDARAAMGRGLEQKVITRDRSVIPACDIETLEQFEELVKQTADVDGIGGYKIGFELGLATQHYSLQQLKSLISELSECNGEIQSNRIKNINKDIIKIINELPDELLLGGLERVVTVARKYTDKPIIYDHQKAGTDIPDTGKNYAKLMKKSGVDAVIFFPQAGPETERAWIYHALDNGLKVIVGGRMTHPAYSVSEGGFITDEGALDMYRIAARAGVNNFVVPGNKPAVIKQVRDVVEAEGVSPIFYATGFVAQGGKIEAAAKVAGDSFHGIVGRGIYGAKDIGAAAIKYTSQL